MTTPLLHPLPTYFAMDLSTIRLSYDQVGLDKYLASNIVLGLLFCYIANEVFCLDPQAMQGRIWYSSLAKIVRNERRAAWNNSCLEVCNLCSSSCQFVQVPHLCPTLCIWYFPVKQVQCHFINKHKVKVLLTCGLWRNEILHIFAGQKIMDWLTSHFTWLTTPLVLALLKETEILNHSCQA